MEKNYYISGLGFEIIGNSFFDSGVVVPTSNELRDCDDFAVANELNELFKASIIEVAEDETSYRPAEDIEKIFTIIASASMLIKVTSLNEPQRLVLIYKNNSGEYSYIEKSLLRPQKMKIGLTDSDGIASICLLDMDSNDMQITSLSDIQDEKKPEFFDEYMGLKLTTGIEKFVEISETLAIVDFISISYFKNMHRIVFLKTYPCDISIVYNESAVEIVPYESTKEKFLSFLGEAL